MKSKLKKKLKVYFNGTLEKVIAEDIISKVNIQTLINLLWMVMLSGKEDVVNTSKDNPVVLEVIDVIMAGRCF